MPSLPPVLLRLWTFLFTLLTTALIGNAIASAFAGNPSSVNYSIFVCVFSWLALLYGLTTSMIMESLAIPVVLMVMDGVAALLTMIAGVVLAAKLGVHSCGNEAYLKANSLTNGSHDMEKRCHELQASTAFFWFMFLGFAGSVFFDFAGSRSGGGSSRGGVRKGGPTMSQV